MEVVTPASVATSVIEEENSGTESVLMGQKEWKYLFAAATTETYPEGIFFFFFFFF
jgi:hypothetical protein